MGVRSRWTDDDWPGQRSRVLLLLPVVLIVVIATVDLRSPTDIHLGPLLVIAPALAPSLAGALATAGIGALAVAAQVVIAVFHGGLATSNHIAQIIALTVLTVLIVVFTVVRERRARQLAQVRSVAETAQRALLRPLPDRIGPLHIASTYLAAVDEAQIGGDLYTATRTPHATRLLIGDVRGKGLAAVGEAALLLSAFRLVAARAVDLTELAGVLDRHVQRYLLDFAASGDETGEHFITALLLEFPDDEPLAYLTNCGHPSPLRLRHGEAVVVGGEEAAPPLGLQALTLSPVFTVTIPFDVDETLLLHTDGVTEARDSTGTFYPLAERAAHWADAAPEALVNHLRRDLLAYTGGQRDDDAALVAIRRTSVSNGPEPAA
ncbi:serine phosphatase RsbU (regulator of sigma subunit) [Catenulispora sp. MAP5-51]|uniref:PP2C family protein-serine/threonine phosphatase n=1 Tax=Catenulispora sp. MAP5-51 TaxID=3156298 RepID=UPI003512270A